ncbi:hypothetical protein G6011_06998 [Alternaria panax]|uniref:Uncharacterized protein n=1 Tax=Alternaria panax TaxID=48097 RepID=A0AAD4I541_9PLEO|nr:hypothetical protein G6011_06998 [Alternaria panax]
MPPDTDTPAVSSRPWADNANVSREVAKSPDFINHRVALDCERLNRYSGRIHKGRETVEALTARVDAQEQQNIGYEQLVRGNRLEALVAQLAQSVNARPDAVMKLDQRMDELYNQAVGHKTIADTNLRKTDWHLQEIAQRTQSLERASNRDSQKIAELELDMEHRFETAVINAQESLRHSRNDCVKSHKILRTQTAEKIVTSTNDFAAAHDVVQSQVNKHTETFKKTAVALDCISQRIEEFEAAQYSHGTAVTTCETATTMLGPLYAHLNAVEAASTAF